LGPSSVKRQEKERKEKNARKPKFAHGQDYWYLRERKTY
jgi:hypothetical protein